MECAGVSQAKVSDCGGSNPDAKVRDYIFSVEKSKGNVLTNIEIVRVFTGNNCDGDAANLGIIDRCWDVSFRYSYQVYC